MQVVVRSCHRQALDGADVVRGEVQDMPGTIRGIYVASGHGVCLLVIVQGECILVACPIHALELQQWSVVFSQHVECCVFDELSHV
jgi:hypothetical protein